MKRQLVPASVRARAIQRVREHLLRDSFPRLQMALLVSLTGGFGLLASFGLLQLGLHAMALRYPLALALAYVFFLFLIGLWLRMRAEDLLDLPDVVDLLPGPGGAPRAPDFVAGGGGDFGGGGVSASFDRPAGAVSEAVADAVPTPLKAVGETLGSAGDADELAIPLLVIALAIGIALASLYVVYIAPVLFAEVLVDGALSYVLFRRLRGQEARHWISSAFRRTVFPFLATAVFLAAVGAAMSSYAPGARSLGQVIGHATAPLTED